MRHHRPHLRALARVLVGGMLLCVVLVGGQRTMSRAAGTDPTLMLVEADAFATASGATAVSVLGTFHFDDLVQFSFPAGLLVFQGQRFARFDFDGSVAEGTDQAVADGVTAEEIPGLLSAGQPAADPAGLLTVQPDRVTASLPSSFGPGAASVLVFAVLERKPPDPPQPFVSNTLSVTIP